MKRLFFSLIVIFSTASIFSQATELFISEYIEGTSYNKAIEIFNGTGSDVDLSEYSLEKDVNGNEVWGNTYNYSGILADGEVFVLANSQADPQILAVADDTNNGVINFNGNDQVRLLRNGVEIDRFGEPGGAYFAQDVTMVRRDDVISPTTPWNTDEWLTYSVNTFSYLGYHVFQNEDPLIIVTSPNGGEEWTQGSTQSITWESYNFDDDVMIELENLTNRTREILTASTENDGVWSWSIPNDQPLGDDYVIVISEVVTGIPSDMSDNPFSIIEPIQVLELTIYEIQNSQGGPSLYEGEIVRTSGVVTAIFANYFFIQDGPGEWNGIAIYPMQEVNIGDDITITGTVLEYMGKTEITDILELIITGTAPLPEAVTISTATLASFEEYESVLIRLQEVTVTSEQNTYGEWEVDDGSGACMLGALGDYTYVPVLDDFIFSITGVVDYTYSNFKLQPRDDNDFNLIGLIIDPLVLNFLTIDDCLQGLAFTISNLTANDVTLYSIDSSGTFSSGNLWEIEDFSLTFPYTLESGNELDFNVVVALPVQNQLREIVSDEIVIDSDVGSWAITLNLDTDLNVGNDNNLLAADIDLKIYPNPFAPSSAGRSSATTISYNLNNEISENTELGIYNLKGQLVKSFSIAQQEGQVSIIWDGRNDHQKTVSSGIYFARLKAGRFEISRKLLLTK